LLRALVVVGLLLKAAVLRLLRALLQPKVAVLRLLRALVLVRLLLKAAVLWLLRTLVMVEGGLLKVVPWQVLC
jgi:hypothetical protein